MSNFETVAQAVVRLLKEAGADTVFGLPGGENVELLEALRQADIRFVLVKNESSAVYMADVYARLTAKLGIVLTTLGPGASNAFVGMAHADLDRAPVLLLSAETNQSFLPDHTHQVYDLQTIFQPICKLTLSLNPENVYEAVTQALTTMFAGRPGPVHLSLSREMAAKAAKQQTETKQQSKPSKLDQNALNTAKNALDKAKRPIIIAGLGLEPQKPYDALKAFAEASDAPVIVTPKAKGALSDKHPLAVGTIGLTRTDPVYDLIEEADLIIAIGFDVVELVKPWNEDAPLIWIAAWENSKPKLPSVCDLEGDIATILRTLSQNPKEKDDWGEARVSSFQKKQAQKVLAKASEGLVLPQEVLKSARKYLFDDTLITTDVGSHKILSALEWQAFTENRYMLSNGLSAMGFGLSAAIAGALALNELTVCITGDAGFSMVIGELSIIKEQGLAVMIIVMNDSALDLIRSAQHRSGKESFGTEFINPDFAHIAKAYDLDYYQVNSPESCDQVFSKAVQQGSACLIEARIDPISYPSTPSVSKGA